MQGCVCGYRVCQWIEIAVRYMFPPSTVFRPRRNGEPAYKTNPAGLVLVRVEAGGKIVVRL